MAKDVTTLREAMTHLDHGKAVVLIPGEWKGRPALAGAAVDLDAESTLYALHPYDLVRVAFLFGIIREVRRACRARGMELR